MGLVPSADEQLEIVARDLDLVAALQSGDTNLFAELVDAWSPALPAGRGTEPGKLAAVPLDVVGP